MNKIRVAVAGNPNSGKTSIFNALTGSRQHVGNYPGVTIEKKEGSFEFDGVKVDITDLPGTYSLACRSLEEKLARDFIINEKPDVIVDVIDASNLERNLYLATQLMELEIPMVLILNMSDHAKNLGQKINTDYFAQLTNTIIVETVGHKRIGIIELKKAIVAAAKLNKKPHKVDFGAELNEVFDDIASDIKNMCAPELARYPQRWLSIKLLENDKVIFGLIESEPDGKKIISKADHLRNVICKHVGDDITTILIEKRYGYISGLYRETAILALTDRKQISEQVDNIMLHRVLGIPIFLGLMYLVFYITFKIGDLPMHLLESLFNWLGTFISGIWPAGADSWLKSLIVDGVIGGVGGVIVFLPNIILLFLAIAILEDSGYMARAAFIIDRLMHKIGLHGKSFIPMMIGFGCTVPAILATRTIEDRKDRLTTMLILPLMSCGARFPIYTLLIPAFFSEHMRARILWLIYMIGILLAVVLAKFLKSTLFKGKSTPFVMELPPYRLPTINGLLQHVLRYSYLYLKKAGTLILAISILMWFLTSYPKKETYDIDQNVLAGDQLTAAQINEVKKAENLEYSLAGKLGSKLEIVFKPLGFDWKISTALIGTFAAKEVFVAQMGIISSLGDTEGNVNLTLREKLKKSYSPLTAFCIMLFCLIATPCMATIAVTRRESGSWKWAALQFFGLTCMAYIITLIVNQVGKLLIGI